MDPLSDILSLLKLTSYACGGFDAGGAWSIGFREDASIKFYAAVSGACWLAVDGVPDAIRIEAGDCLLLPRGRAFRVASDLALPPVDVMTIGSAIKSGGITRYNGGGAFLSVGGSFAVSGGHATMLVEMLPPIVHLHDERDKAALRWCVERMRDELRDPQPGGSLIARQLATMLLVQALRLHLAAGVRDGVGWLFALGDRQMASALGAIHDEPAARWTLRSLAEHAGMSRTSFAVAFKAAVGVAPIEYVTKWRMALARDRLATSGDSVSEIARALGYESESAFSTAFKRCAGASPRQYARGRMAMSP